MSVSFGKLLFRDYSDDVDADSAVWCAPALRLGASSGGWPLTNASSPAEDAEFLPAPLRGQQAGAWELRGQAVVRWSVFDLYRVRYFAPGTEGYPGGNYAIEADYRRAIPSAMLVQATLDEMRRTGCPAQADAPETRDWLRFAFQDVARGDRIVAVVHGGVRIDVFHNGVPTARSNDPELVRAFAGIWLGPHSRVPQLRSPPCA